MAKATGKGSECWACCRVWAVNISHTWPNRDKAEYQAKLAIDMKLLTRHKSFKDDVNNKARTKIESEVASTIQFLLVFVIVICFVFVAFLCVRLCFMSLIQGTENQDGHGIKRKRVSQKQFSRRELVDEGAREKVFAFVFTFGTGLLFL